MKTLKLVFRGRDRFDRTVYESDEGTLYVCDKGTLYACKTGTSYVDIDPSSNYAHLHTKSSNEFDGEHESPIEGDDEANFFPKDIRW